MGSPPFRSATPRERAADAHQPPSHQRRHGGARSAHGGSIQAPDEQDQHDFDAVHVDVEIRDVLRSIINPIIPTANNAAHSANRPTPPLAM